MHPDLIKIRKQMAKLFDSTPKQLDAIQETFSIDAYGTPRQRREVDPNWRSSRDIERQYIPEKNDHFARVYFALLVMDGWEVGAAQDYVAPYSTYDPYYDTEDYQLLGQRQRSGVWRYVYPNAADKRDVYEYRHSFHSNHLTIEAAQKAVKQLAAWQAGERGEDDFNKRWDFWWEVQQHPTEYPVLHEHYKRSQAERVYSPMLLEHPETEAVLTQIVARKKPDLKLHPTVPAFYGKRVRYLTDSMEYGGDWSVHLETHPFTWLCDYLEAAPTKLAAAWGRFLKQRSFYYAGDRTADEFAAYLIEKGVVRQEDLDKDGSGSIDTHYSENFTLFEPRIQVSWCYVGHEDYATVVVVHHDGNVGLFVSQYGPNEWEILPPPQQSITPIYRPRYADDPRYAEVYWDRSSDGAYYSGSSDVPDLKDYPVLSYDDSDEDERHWAQKWWLVKKLQYERGKARFHDLPPTLIAVVPNDGPTYHRSTCIAYCPLTGFRLEAYSSYDTGSR